MFRLVIDTSVAIKWLNQDNEKDIEKADRILLDVERGNAALLAPDLLKYEVGNVLLKGKQLSFDQAKICLDTLYSLPITFVSETEDLSSATFRLAHKLNITYYDAAFIAVAKDYEARLITDNIKHQGKPSGVKVTSLKNY